MNVFINHINEEVLKEVITLLNNYDYIWNHDVIVVAPTLIFLKNLLISYYYSHFYKRF